MAVSYSRISHRKPPRNFRDMHFFVAFFFHLSVFLGSEICAQSTEDENLSSLALHVRELDAILDANLASKSRSGRSTSCSCSLVRNPYCCEQTLCTCDFLCYTGTEFVSLGDATCQAWPYSVDPDGPLSPATCQENATWYKRWVHETMEENQRRGIGQREVDTWLGSRKKVTWRSGTTYFQALSQDTTNISHFIGRIMYLLLVTTGNGNRGLDGNGTEPIHVDRFLFPRAPICLHRMREHGLYGFQISLLRALLHKTTKDLFGQLATWYWTEQQSLLLGDKSLGMGRIEFEESTNEADEERPMCFERVVFPGVLKAVSFPGGVQMAQSFSKELFHAMRLQPEPPRFGKVRLLWVRRNFAKTKGRRSLVEESLAKLEKLFVSLDLEVTKAYFEDLYFSEQIQKVQESEIIFAVHGAGLTIPGSFGRSGSVILELMPYRLYHPMYLFKSAATGVTHMMHQCRQGTPQEKDDYFSSTGVRFCMMKDQKCKDYFAQKRKIELTLEDLSELKKLLKLAIGFVLDSRDGTKISARNLAKVFPKCLSREKNWECRENLVLSPLASQSVCVLDSECPYP